MSPKPAAAARPQASATRPLPYGRQAVDDDDIAAVVEVLRGDWLTTGPLVERFEAAFAQWIGTSQAVAVSSGTAALHALYHAVGIGPGDEVIVPALTFAATANAAVYLGADPVIVDVDPATLLLDPGAAAAAIGPRTRAVVAVDYAGQPCDYTALGSLCRERGVMLLADACHAVGGADHGTPVGRLARASCFSLHPVKHFTSAEGGLIATDDTALAARARTFRNHGIDTDHRVRERLGTWAYDMATLGYNYRLSDLQCALGLSQLHKVRGWVARRRAIAERYDRLFADSPAVRPLARRLGAEHAYHLYVVRIDPQLSRLDRDAVFTALRESGIGAAVHYPPLHLHSYYRGRYGTAPGRCPHAEAAARSILSLPMFPTMSDADVDRVAATLRGLTELQ